MLQIAVASELVIITHLENKSMLLSQKQIQSIFMGRRRAFPNGKMAIPLEQPDLRTDFYQQLTGRSIAQINAYWARLRFGGRNVIPKKYPNDEAIIQQVENDKFSIAYILKNNVDETRVHVLFSLNGLE